MKNRLFRRLTESVTVLRCCSILLLALVFGTLFFLHAASAEEKDAFPNSKVDVSHKGSLHVIIEDGNGNPVSGGTVQLYCVARVTQTKGSPSLVLTNGFTGWGGNTEMLSSDRTCAENLAAFVNRNNTARDASAAIRSGTAEFSDLEPGVFLVMQKEPSPGYGTMLPFLAFLPQTSGGELVYDVQAHPKPVKKIPPGSVEITVQKEVVDLSGTSPADTPFSFMLTADTPGAPLPKGGSSAYSSGQGSVTVSRRGPGMIDFGLFSFTEVHAGFAYEYYIKEVKGSAANYVYDSTVYKLTIRISADDNGSLSASVVFTDTDGKTVEKPVFRNRYIDVGSSVPPSGGITSPSDTTTFPHERTTAPGGKTTTVPHERITTVPHERSTTVPNVRSTTRPGERITTAYTTRGPFENNEKMPQLPQTGQLWWPVFAMAPAGILLLILGVIHLRKGKAEEAEDAAS